MEFASKRGRGPRFKSVQAHFNNTKNKMKRLYRSKDRIIGGVCGGIAEHLGVDPTLIRVLWVVGSLMWGAGVFAYLLCWLIIPEKGGSNN